MDRVLIGVAILAGVSVVFLLLARGWRARGRAQEGIGEPASPPDDLGAPTFTEDLLYVASTRAEAPLDRITIAGLGFRARAVLSTAPAGLVLDLAGRGPVFIPTESILGVGRATWTIDRVVDTDGLVFLRWRLGSTGIDSYLRSADPDRLVAALTDLTELTAPTPPHGVKEADA